MAAAAAAANGGNNLALPPPNAATRVRSLNPFEDPNDVSYEDTLFGHEFDRIRQEVVTTTSSSSSAAHRHYSAQPASMKSKFCILVFG